MLKIYNENGLPFFTADWIRDRGYVLGVVHDIVSVNLYGKNGAWRIHRIEAPSLIPTGYVSSEYDNKDVFRIWDENVAPLTLRPETTASSYEYARYLLEHQEAKPPLCIWQASKSYRRENDQVSANVRLKEFYQQEFQCIVTEDTKMDYQELAQPIATEVAHLLGVETRVVESDRVPSYSQRTVDIEAKTPHKWLEVCSISKRTDVPFAWAMPNTQTEKPLVNYEFAFGLDRLVYAKRINRAS